MTATSDWLRAVPSASKSVCSAFKKALGKRFSASPMEVRVCPKRLEVIDFCECKAFLQQSDRTRTTDTVMYKTWIGTAFPSTMIGWLTQHCSYFSASRVHREPSSWDKRNMHGPTHRSGQRRCRPKRSHLKRLFSLSRHHHCVLVALW